MFTNKSKERVPREMNSDKVGGEKRGRGKGERKHNSHESYRVVSWIGNDPLERHGSGLIHWIKKSSDKDK